jgi:hypothetical protein
MHGLLHWSAEARAAAEPHAVTYIDFLTVTLTALCAILAVLAIIIAAAAIWGYVGIREEITKAVSEKADEALKAKLKEYPDSQEVLGLFEEMRDQHEKQKLLSNRLLADSASKFVADTSKKVEDKAKNKTRLARDYPGKGK